MLDTVHAYARKLLVESGSEAACRRRHAAVVLAAVEDGERHYCAAEQDAWIRQLERDHDNVRAALGWSIESGDAVTATRLGAAIWPFWSFQGYLAEAGDWLARILALEGRESGQEAARGKALLGACWVALDTARYEEAIGHAKESVALFARCGDEAGYVRALETLGFAHLELGDLGPAEPIFEECLARSRGSADERRQAIALNALGQVRQARGDVGRAEELYRSSVELARRAELPHSLGQGLLRLGDVARRRGAPGDAMVLYEEAFETFCALGERHHVAWSLSSIGSALAEFGRTAEAREKYAEALGIFHEIGSAVGTARALTGLARIALARADVERGIRLLGAVEEIVARGHRLPPVDADALAALRAEAGAKLRGTAYGRLRAEGAALDAGALLALARAEGAAVRHRATG
jgi:tetratricopeptide (TPR) repeat protein